MFDALVSALLTLFSWPVVLFLILGVIIGLTFGAIPGLGGVIAIALVIPFTFGIETTNAVVLFGAILGGVAFGGSISAILLNVPGTAPNIATLLDGYPMTQQGRSGEALAISATSSALGAIFGLLVLLALIPVARRLLLSFSSPEFFWLAVLGLCAVAATSRNFLLKGIAAGGIGFMLALIGYSPVTGELRYIFGTNYLWDGIQLIPALIGLYAIGEALQLSTEDGTLTKTSSEISGSVTKGVMYVLTNPIKLLRASVTGVIIGIVPGVGGIAANFIAYMQASQTASDDSFGEGNPAGVLASEAANDAKDGGALLPTVVFGIPGSAVMAVILGGLILHGLTPGTSLLNDDVDMLFLLLLSLLFSNIFTSLIGLAITNQLTKITRVNVSLLVPIILVISLVGSYALRGNFGDVLVTILFGFVGYVMAAHDYPRVALVLGLILGELAEVSFLQSLQISDSGYLIFVSRPVSLVLIVLVVLSLAWPFRKSIVNFDPAGTLSGGYDGLRTVFSPSSVTLPGLRTILSGHPFSCDEKYYDLLFIAVSAAFLLVLLSLTLQYGPDTRLFPLVVGVPTVLSLVVLGGLRSVSHPILEKESFIEAEEIDNRSNTSEKDRYEVRKEVSIIVTTLVLAFVVIYAIGLIPGVVVYSLALYYYKTGSWKQALLYGGGLSMFIYLVFILVLNVRLQAGWLTTVL